MGLAELMDRAEKGETENDYTFTMAGKADELVGSIASGDLDIVLVPANVASILYTKTQGNVNVIDINTLGVLYVVASDGFHFFYGRPERKDRLHDRKRNYPGICNELSPF